MHWISIRLYIHGKNIKNANEIQRKKTITQHNKYPKNQEHQTQTEREKNVKTERPCAKSKKTKRGKFIFKKRISKGKKTESETMRGVKILRSNQPFRNRNNLLNIA